MYVSLASGVDLYTYHVEVQLHFGWYYIFSMLPEMKFLLCFFQHVNVSSIFV